VVAAADWSRMSSSFPDWGSGNDGAVLLIEPNVNIPHPRNGQRPVLVSAPASAGLPSACSSATCLIAVLDGGGR
jgi:hypothetical protein